MIWKELLAVALLGGLTGCRSMTPMALVCVFAWRGSLLLSGGWAFWAKSPVTAIVFFLLALGELVGDKMPFAPNRTSAFPLVARVFFGGLVGALVFVVGYGAILGGIAAVVGAFAGFAVRKSLVNRGWNAIVTAICEDLVVVSGTLTAIWLLVSVHKTW